VQPEARGRGSIGDDVRALIRLARLSLHAGSRDRTCPSRDHAPSLVHDGGMQIRIEGSDLPGRRCAGSGDFPGYENVHVGVQRRNRRDELLDLQPGDAPSAVWTFDASVIAGSTGPDVRGP
jgi:hypothetical protein